MNPYLALIIAACLWGCTNPYINASAGKQVSLPFAVREVLGLLPKSLSASLTVFLNPYFLIPYVINLIGSGCFLFALRAGPLSVVSIVTNALALTLTGLVGKYVLKEQSPVSGGRMVLSTVTVLIGSGLCASNPPL